MRIKRHSVAQLIYDDPKGWTRTRFYFFYPRLRISIWIANWWPSCEVEGASWSLWTRWQVWRAYRWWCRTAPAEKFGDEPSAYTGSTST